MLMKRYLWGIIIIGVSIVGNSCSGKSAEKFIEIEKQDNIDGNGGGEGMDIRDKREEAIAGESPEKWIGDGVGKEGEWILIEQAVDAWMYFNLSDYRSYEPLTRATIFNEKKGVYEHKVRFRSMNSEGGMVTQEWEFEVDLGRKGENGNPYWVRRINL